MRSDHKYYLSLGSNIDAEANLAKAVDLLRGQGKVKQISNVWKSHAVGAAGPDFLNICLVVDLAVEPEECKERVLRPIEAQMGRLRGEDKNAPRPVDIDMLMADGQPVNASRWAFAFVIVPLAELLPDFPHPLENRPLAAVSADARNLTWIVRYSNPLLFPD
jgi:2-amino-4-hydroxy-6-hydroxymethyldihydropteridine diphosphokinase